MIFHCKFDELVDPAKLKHHPKNHNEHPPEQIDRLIKIIGYQGWRYAVKVSKLSGYVTSGHGRIAAAFKAGWKQVPVVYQEYTDSDQEYLDVQSDNAIASWAELNLKAINADIPELGPFDIDLLGIKDFEVEALDKYADKDADEIPEARKTDIKLGDLFQLGNHRLLCGDATSKEDVQRLMNGEKADFCFTSPPYSDQRDYSGGLNLDPKHLAKFLEAECELWAVNLGLKRRDGEIELYWNDYLLKAKEIGLPLFSWNVWDRSGEGGSIGAMTAEFPIQHEFIFIFGKTETNRFIPNKSAGRETKTTIRQADGALRRSFWKAHAFGKLGTILKTEIDKGKSEVKHPAKFPVSLPTQYILACSDPNDKVYEPFLGSGSTLIACEKTNRRCFGMEIDPSYCQVIIDRWEKFTGQKAIKPEEKPKVIVRKNGKR